MFTKAFWNGAAERAARTFAQSLLAVLGGNGLGLLDADWLAALSVAGMAVVASLLTSIAAPGPVPNTTDSKEKP
jgi:hypothetical protein